MSATFKITSVKQAIEALAALELLHMHVAAADGDDQPIEPGDDYYLQCRELRTHKTKGTMELICTAYKVRESHYLAARLMGKAWTGRLSQDHPSDKPRQWTIQALDGPRDVILQQCAAALGEPLPDDWLAQLTAIVEWNRRRVIVHPKIPDVVNTRKPIVCEDAALACKGGCGFFAGAAGFCSRCAAQPAPAAPVAVVDQ
jgi:hypothetical protein